VTLLLDANLSWRLLATLEPLFPGSVQVGRLGVARTDDATIWQYARDHGLAIVTYDADFIDLARLRGAPPKIIWLRTGNMATAALRQLFLARNSDP
jgi:predicted nuclease of predicted toxin-antitoxin system